MSAIKDNKKYSNIFHKKTLYCNIKRYNSPIFSNNKIKNYLLVNENSNDYKKSIDLKITKSSKDIENNKKNISKNKIEISKDKEINSYKKHLIYSKSPYNSNENIKIINYIKKKITFQSINAGFSKRNSNDNIFNNIYKKAKITSNYSNINKNNPSVNSLNNNSNNNLKKNNYTDKIYFDKNKKKLSTSKKKYFYSSKLSFSLENILSRTINKNYKKPKQKSFEKAKIFAQKNKYLKNKFSVNEINKTNLKLTGNELLEKSNPNLNTNLQNTKINLEKNRKIYRYYRKKENKMKTENITEIMSRLTKSNIINNIEGENRYSDVNHNKNKKTDMINNNILIKKIISSSSNNNLLDYKKSDRQLNYSKDNSELILDESYNAFNDAKILCEYNSTNDRSLNTKNNESNKNKITITPNINRNKNNKFSKYNNNNNCEKNKLNNNILKDSDGFITYELDVDNEQNNQINGIKTNNFDVKKPKDENLKFTFIKDEKESEVSISHASKIIIGNIDGYKDIIETDIKNNENIHSKCFSNLIMNKKTNLFNNTIKKDSEIGENTQKEVKKKISNLSTLLKKESGVITFNDCNFYDSLNMTNNLDGISSTITNNIINKNKIDQINKNNNVGKNEEFNNVTFVGNTDKSIDSITKIANYSIIKCNKLDDISNNNNRKQIINNKYNNKYINNQYKSDEIEKKDDVNTNCKIF